MMKTSVGPQRRIAVNIDDFGQGYARRNVAALQKRAGAEERLAKAQAKRERRAARRLRGATAHTVTIDEAAFDAPPSQG